jgi:hypothetical protein
MRWILFILILFLGAACESKSRIEVSSQSTRAALVDGTPPLGELIHIEPVGEDSLIILDNRQNLHLFSENRFVKLLGKKGEGSGEYSRVSAFCVYDGSIVIFDKSKLKLLSFSLGTNECEFEKTVRSEEFAALSALVVNDETMYFIKTELSSVTPDHEQVFFKLNSDQTLTPLGLAKRNLQGRFLRSPIKLMTSVKQRAGKLYFTFPLSPIVWEYDVISHSLSSITVGLELPDDSDLASADNLSSALKLVNEKVELIMGVFPLDRHLAIVTKQGRPPDSQWKIRFYSYQGEFRGEIWTSYYVYDVQENYYAHIELSGDIDDYPYVVVQTPYQIHP